MGTTWGKKLISYKLIWHLSIHKPRIIIEQNKEFGEQMKIIQIPAVKQLVNISITLIQALSKTCWRTDPLCWSYQSVTTCQKFARMLQPCLLPSGAQHDKLNPIIYYHISSTQVFLLFLALKITAKIKEYTNLKYLGNTFLLKSLPGCLSHTIKKPVYFFVTSFFNLL